MKQAKCTSCGSNINIDENSKTGICSYCNTPYITEELPKIENQTNNSANVINNYYSAPASQSQTTNIRTPRTPRPKINAFLAILGFIFYIVPGILYIVAVKIKQKEWDDKYTY